MLLQAWCGKLVLPVLYTWCVCAHVRYQLGGGAVVWKPQHQNLQVEWPEADDRLCSSDVYELV